MSGYAFAVDIGGTFSDAVPRRDDGATWTDKALTTHGDRLDGFFAAACSTSARSTATTCSIRGSNMSSPT